MFRIIGRFGVVMS